MSADDDQKNETEKSKKQKKSDTKNTITLPDQKTRFDEPFFSDIPSEFDLNLSFLSATATSLHDFSPGL